MSILNASNEKKIAEQLRQDLEVNKLKAVIEKAQLDADTKERDERKVLERELAKEASVKRSEPLEVK